MNDQEKHYKLHVKIPALKKGEGRADEEEVDLTSNISENDYFK